MATKVDLELGRIDSGFHLPDLNWAALSDHEIFRRYRKVRRLKPKVGGGGQPSRDNYAVPVPVTNVTAPGSGTSISRRCF